MSVNVAWGIVILGIMCFFGFLIVLSFDTMSKIRVAITITFIIAFIVCLFVGCPVIYAYFARQCAIVSIINGTPDNGYTIYYDGKPADLETRRMIKSMYDSSTYHNFRFKYDRKVKKIWMTER